jgi:hypothetical protein
MKINFSIRDLFFIVIIAAILFGWCIDRNKLWNENAQLKDNFKKQDVELQRMTRKYTRATEIIKEQQMKEMEASLLKFQLRNNEGGK